MRSQLKQVSEFALQIQDLTHVWSNGDSDIIGSDKILALATAVYMHVKLHLSSQQKYPRSLPELLVAFTALLVRQQPDDVPGIHSASTVQRVVHAECCNSWAMNSHLSHPWVVLTSSVSGKRCGNIYREIPHLASTGSSCGPLANQLAATHFGWCPIQCPSTANQVGMVAWFVTVTPFRSSFVASIVEFSLCVARFVLVHQSW